MKQLQGKGYTPPPVFRAQEEREHVAPAFRLEIARSLRLHPKLALAVAAAVFLLIVGYALTRKPKYQAVSLTYVEPLATNVLSDGSPGFFDPSRYDSFIEQQIQTAQRSDILRAAVESLPPGVWRYPNESVQAAVSRLAGSLKVMRVDTSYQLAISVTGSDPVGTAAVVNAVTNAFLEQGSKDEHAISAGKVEVLNQERQRLQNQLQQEEAEETALSASLGVASPTGTSTNPYDMQLASIRTELVTAQAAHDQAEAQYQAMNGAGGSQSPAMIAATDDLIAADPGLSSMKGTINQRRALLQSQMAGLTPSNPVYKQDEAEMASVDRDMNTMTAQLRTKAETRLQDKLRGALQQTGAMEAQLTGQLNQATAKAAGAAPKLQRATELSADIIRLQGSLAGVDTAVRALELETHGPGMAHLSMAATVPTAPMASRRGLLLLLAFPLALLAGIAAAVFARKRDPRVYTAQDVELALGFPPMSVMPSEHEVSGPVVEEYLLRLAGGVERAHRSDGARSFVFTPVSASTKMKGFMRALQRKLTTLGFTAMAMDVDGVLRPERESELELTLPRIGQQGFVAAQLEALKQEHNLLLIEAHALLQSAEAEYVVCTTDATILVAESGVTTFAELREAASLLHRLHSKGVAVVLQRVQLSFAEPEFRTKVERLEQMTGGAAPGVLSKGPSTASSVSAAARQRVREQKETSASGAQHDNAATTAESRFPGFDTGSRKFVEGDRRAARGNVLSIEERLSKLTAADERDRRSSQSRTLTEEQAAEAREYIAQKKKNLQRQMKPSIQQSRE